MNNWQVVAIAVAAMTIIVLTSIAAYYLWRVRQLNLRLELTAKLELEQAQKARQENIDSIQFIAQALIQGQVTTAEASLRISRLFDFIELDSSIREDFCAIDHMSKKIEHIPVLEAWKALSKPEKRQYQNLIDKLEADFDDLVKDAATRLSKADFV